MYAGIARNDSERQQALILAAKSFSAHGAQEDLRILNKTSLLCNHPGFSSNSTIIVCDSGGNVLGSAFLVDCVMPFKNVMMLGVFVSSVSIREDSRGKGLSRLLMAAVIESARLCKADIVILIARRAVDGYYNRFGFWGVSHYSKATLDISTLPEVKFAPNSIELIPVVADDLDWCSAVHTDNYKEHLGHCLRTPMMWRYILQKAHNMGMRFEMLFVDGKAFCYVVHDGKGNFVEIATDNGGMQCEPSLLLEACAPNIEQVTLHIPPTHAFLQKLEGADVSLTLRTCPFGGHMIRILNPVLFSGLDADVGQTSKPLGYRETMNLLSIGSVTSFDLTRKIGLYGSFNIPLMDQI